jgi:hypothetical protein
MKKPPSGGFLFAAIHGALLSGQRFALLKTTPGGCFIRCHPWRSPFRPTLCVVKNHSRWLFLFAAIHGALLSGQRFALLKTTPSGFLTKIWLQNYTVSSPRKFSCI